MGKMMKSINHGVMKIPVHGETLNLEQAAGISGNWNSLLGMSNLLQRLQQDLGMDLTNGVNDAGVGGDGHALTIKEGMNNGDGTDVYVKSPQKLWKKAVIKSFTANANANVNANEDVESGNTSPEESTSL